ncbi:hypothetical protein B1H10_03805 [candidate division KSB1 bacterium 4484_188]|nr:MAG: hypothetical protein B1H10_03805 [candidate division KSB1 bacterium 4484_188]HFE63634.1 DUF393 domain-containing protein [Caldithrix sp.]
MKILRRPDLPWSLLSGFRFIPPFLRDAVYRFVARHRYRWFGKREKCHVPAPDIQDRFLW